MEKVKEVISFETKGSGRGVSYYEQVVKCPRKARLIRELFDGVTRSGYDAAVGTTFHRLAELHHNDIHNTILEVADPADHPIIVEGTRLFQAYTRRFKPGSWGKVLGTEIGLPGDCEPDCDAREMENKVSCECDRKRREVELRKFWGTELTCRIDMAIEVEETRVVHGLELQPGIYLLDWKTAKAKSAQAEKMYQWRPQFHCYMASWNLLFADQPCKGLIAVQCIRHKKLTDDSFIPVLIEFDESEMHTQRVRTMVEMAKTLENTDAPFITECQSWSGCRFLGNDCTGV